MYIGLGINCVALVGNSFWMAPFYQARMAGDLALWRLPGLGAFDLAPAGLLLGGWLAGRLAKRGIMDANQRVVLWASLATSPSP